MYIWTRESQLLSINKETPSQTIRNGVFSFMNKSLFLQPHIQPFEECTLPKHAILRFQHPMVFVGIDQQLGRNTSKDSCIKRRHTLVSQNSIILFTVDAENRCIPFIDKQVRGIGKCTLCRRILFFPVSTPISQLANHISSVSRYCISILKIPSCAIKALKRLLW